MNPAFGLYWLSLCCSYTEWGWGGWLLFILDSMADKQITCAELPLSTHWWSILELPVQQYWNGWFLCWLFFCWTFCGDFIETGYKWQCACLSNGVHILVTACLRHQIHSNSKPKECPVLYGSASAGLGLFQGTGPVWPCRRYRLAHSQVMHVRLTHS